MMLCKFDAVQVQKEPMLTSENPERGPLPEQGNPAKGRPAEIHQTLYVRQLQPLL